MEFTSVALRRTINHENEEELSVSFTESYGVTLKQFHGMIVRPIFAVCSVTFFLNIHTYIHTYVYINKKNFFFLLFQSSWQ